MVLNFRGLPSGRVIDCTRPMPGTLVTALVIRSITRKSAELRRSLSVSTSNISGFIREMGKCRSAAAKPSFAGRAAGRYFRWLYPGWPSDDGGPQAPPKANPHGAFGLQKSEPARDSDHRGSQCQGHENRHDH